MKYGSWDHTTDCKTKELVAARAVSNDANGSYRVTKAASIPWAERTMPGKILGNSEA